VTVEIRRVDPRLPPYQRLVQDLDRFFIENYPAESNHLLDLGSLCRPEMHFFGIEVDGVARGCGGFWTHDGYVEIKRVYVEPSARGLGLARKLMAVIESEARTLRFTLVRLETGILQPEALGLYKALGYVERGPFGEYGPDPNSVFMEKSLGEI
jgi:putative acetyltransferase